MTTQVTDPFANPASGFDRIQDHADKALIITAREYLTGLTTTHSKTPGDAEAVEADIVVLEADGTYKELPLVRIYQGGLIGQLRRTMGQMIIGRLTKGPSKKGEFAWVIANATDADRALGVAYLQAKANRTMQNPTPAPTAQATPASVPAGADPFGA